jgi:hypothetical protein
VCLLRGTKCILDLYTQSKLIAVLKYLIKYQAINIRAGAKAEQYLLCGTDWILIYNSDYSEF